MTRELVAGDITLSEGGARATLSCRVEARGGSRPAGLPETLWVETPRELAPGILVGGDAFLPVLLLVAMRHEIPRLVIEGDVSALLLASSRRIAEIYQRWSLDMGRPLGLAEVKAAGAAERPRGSSGSAAFFSAGVDSFFTLLRNARRYPRDDDRAITHLLAVGGFDIPLEDEALFGQLVAAGHDVAREMGRTLVPVRTNARDMLREVDWYHFGFGPALAAVALALGGAFHTVYIPSGRSILEPFSAAASHPGVDPLWSTEGLELVHDGCDTPRVDKVPLVAASDLALRHLRVCWENRGGRYNCGRCEKCVRTKVMLALHGALARATTLPGRIEPEDLERAPRSAQERWRRLVEEIRARAGAAVEWLPVVDAVEAGLARASWDSSLLGRMDGTVSRWLRRAGVTASRLDALDVRLLGGRGGRIYRRFQRRTPGARSGRSPGTGSGV